MAEKGSLLFVCVHNAGRSQMAEAGLPSDREQETILMPWEAVHSVETQKEYLRKSRFFLEFAGIVDPTLMHHKSGVNRLVIPREREELQRGMREFILKAQSDSQWAITVPLP